MLEKAERSPALRPEERPALASALRSHRTRAVLVETQAALFDSGARRRLIGLALSGGIEPRARLAVALALTVPPVARKVIPRDTAGEHGLAPQA